MIQKENTYTLFKISNKINEIIDKINTIPDPPKPTKGTKAGDICYVSGGKKYFCTADQWNDNLGIPIGVVVVPSSHNADGSSTIMSLCNMNCLDPEHGGAEKYNQDDPGDFESKYGMCWGDTNTAVPGITQSTLQPVVDPVTGTSTGTIDIFEVGPSMFTSDAWLDSDIRNVVSQMFEGLESYVQGVDTESCYLDGSAIDIPGFIPSPYLANGSKNPEYNVTGTAFEAINGKSDTDCIMNVTTQHTTGAIPNNDYSVGSYPAATCCHRFYTEGTSAGDWYLPSIAETGYIAARIMKINESLRKLGNGNNAIEIGTIIEELNGCKFGFWMWASTETIEDDALGYFSDLQRCLDYVKYNGHDGRVRAFTQVFGTKVNPKPQPTPPTPTYEYVDLGLPSGLKWAKCNVGAEHEYDPGLYFAWGETTGYAGDAGHNFAWANYKWSVGGSSSNFSKYNSTGATLDLEDDAAHVNLGGSWRMPTKTEIEELINNTTRTWTTNYNGTGKAGYIVKSKTNSNQIFMPAAGYCSGTSLGDFGSHGRYWSSSQYSGYSGSGHGLYFYSDDFDWHSYARFSGFSVRGVCE